MKAETITISNPNPYDSQPNEFGVRTPMISFVVTGAGKEQFRKDQAEKGFDSQDDNGNPLIHFTQKAGVKYGDTAVLERAVLENGEVIWFDPTQQEEKILKNLIAGMDDTTKAMFAQAQLEKARALAKTLVANRQSNIAKLKAQPKDSGKLGSFGKSNP